MTYQKWTSSTQRTAFSLLLCLLHWLVRVQEKVSQWLEKPLHNLQLAAIALGLKQKPIARKRGSQPAFPATVAIILAEEWAGQETLDNLTPLLHWASSAGVQNLQLYESAGKLQANAKALSCCLNFMHDKYSVKLWSDTVHKDSCLANGPAKNQVEIEGIEHCQVSITLLSEEDGHLPVVEAIKAGASKNAVGSATPEAFMEQIRAAVGPHAVHQPNLVWVFGPVLTLAGFPPWLVRQSEIHGMGKLADLHQKDVHKALQLYCQTSQRFGR